MQDITKEKVKNTEEKTQLHFYQKRFREGGKTGTDRLLCKIDLVICGGGGVRYQDKRNKR